MVTSWPVNTSNWLARYCHMKQSADESCLALIFVSCLGTDFYSSFIRFEVVSRVQKVIEKEGTVRQVDGQTGSMVS